MMTIAGIVAIPRYTVKADDFSGNLLESAWQYVNPGMTYLLPVYAFDVQNQSLDYGTKLLREVPAGDWCIETQILFHKDSKSFHSGLCVYEDGQNYLLFGSEGGIKASVFGIVGGKPLAWPTDDKQSLEGTYQFFAIEKSGNRYSFYASLDGDVWDVLSSVYIDNGENLATARIGLINRYIGMPADVFQSSEKEIPAWFVEFSYFILNGEGLPFPNDDQNGWTLRKSMGVFVLPVRSGATSVTAPRLLRSQKEGNWTVEGMLSYLSEKHIGDTLAGLALYVDDQNYLIFGVRNGYGTPCRFELSGMIGGHSTGALLQVKHTQNGNRTLRITKRTQDGTFPIYYFYAPDNTYVGKYVDDAGLFDKALYGAMAYEASGNQDTAYVAVFEHISEMMRDAYTDFFTSKPMDGVWNVHHASVQIGKERMVVKADTEDEMGMVLRYQMKQDWVIDTTIANVQPGAEAGLALCGKDEVLFFTYNGEFLFLRGEGEVTVFKPEGKVNHLRLIKETDCYKLCYSESGLAWDIAFEYTDKNYVLKGGQYGFAVKGKATFFKFSETLRPTGAISGISKIEMIGALTGEEGMNRTQSRWGMGSTDLGSMFTYKGKTYGVYGDTFAQPRLQGAWIHNAVSVGTVDSPADGVRFEAVYIGKDKRGVVPSTVAEYVCAVIPSCGFGFEVNGIDTLYMWVHEIYGWTVPGHRDVQGSGWAVSVDEGKTWEYSGSMFDGNSKFQFVTAYLEDDMLYLFGNLGGGYSETYLMCVPAVEVLNRSAYQFYAGLDVAGNPMWTTDEEEAIWVLEQCEREIGIVYNSYLSRFLLTGLDTINDQVVIHESPNLYGPWSPSIPLFSRYFIPVLSAQDKNPHSYGAYSLTDMVSEDGKTMYFTLSQYSPYQVHWLGVTFEKVE